MAQIFRADSKVSVLRRVTQTICFAIIVFGGFFVVRPHAQSEVVDVTGYAGKFERGQGVRWVEREQTKLNAFLPVTACYYQHKGLFSGCSLAFFSEHLTWLTPLISLLPHILFLLVLMFAMGRLWCGWVCPFGFLGDLLTKLRELIGYDHIVLGRPWRDGLVWTKYVLLFASVAVSVLGAVPALAEQKPDLLLPFCMICVGKFVSPFLSNADICWSNYRSWISSTLTLLGFVAFGAFALSFSIRRLYCRICPIGGITAPFNRYGMVALTKKAQKCTQCGACARVCPVDNLTVFEGKSDGAVNACECTLCLRCVEACPEKDCLSFTFAGKRLTGS